MTPEQRERYPVLIRELHMVSRAIIGLTREIVEKRTFAAERATILELFDHAASVAEALVPLDIARDEESRRTVAEARRREDEQYEAHLRAQAEAAAAARARTRQELAEMARRNF